MTSTPSKTSERTASPSRSTSSSRTCVVARERSSHLTQTDLALRLAQAANQAGSSSAAKEVPSAAAVDKQGAEAAKSRGNQLMAKKDYQGAIDAYSEAIDKDGSNPVYWSNRFVSPPFFLLL